ncbi:bZIP transcription factor TGA10-like [Salvia splendens]|uniref:bZIP transcription factor TGA10-like n=1 Tax=Salvia splendens TaxID=180675 RepID=UPI001C26EF79|nr:bZIP transcription factor TGA10-like [Salvia splendens]
MRRHTLNILLSQSQHGEPTIKGMSSGSKRSSEASNPGNDVQESASIVRCGINPQRPTSQQDVPKATDLKTLRRLAQNREAARKSRLKKKAYVQNLESSQIKLNQLQQEMQNARAQGNLLSRNANVGEQGLPYTNITPGATQFNMEYAQWLEEHHHLTVDLKGAVNEYRPEDELCVAIGNWLAHCDQMVGLKSKALKNDIFHVFSGMWKAPAERCFMWMGGFRPSMVIKIAVDQMEGLMEHQRAELCRLQRSTHDAEEAITHEFKKLDRSLTQTISCNTLNLPPDVNTYMTQMAIAIYQVSALQGHVTQGDSLRHQTLHRLQRLLTVRQAAQCFLVIDEYFHRLRSLSTLWLNRTRHD